MKDKNKIATYIGAFMILVHVSGMIGVMTNFRSFFVNLTAVNLMLTFFLMLYFHEEKRKSFWIYMVLVAVLGFTVEVIGVNTGFPFGEYSYGFPFGPQLWDTPPIIGLNWFVLTYGFTYIMRSAKISNILKALIVGLLVTSLDVIIEPVAIHLGYWTWVSEHVPIQNYVTWFVCISLFSYWIYYVEKGSEKWKNPMVWWLIVAQVIYFLGICIYVKLG